MSRNQSGFSLVELLSVIAIIGILAVIAIPMYVSYKVKAREGEAKVGLAAIHAGETAFFVEYNDYTTSLSRIGYAPNGLVRYNIGFFGFSAIEPVNSANICSGTNGLGIDPNCTIPKPVPVLPLSATVNSVAKTFNAVAWGYESSMLSKNENRAPSKWWELLLKEESALACDCSGLPYTSRPVQTWSIDNNKLMLHTTTIGIDFAQP